MNNIVPIGQARMPSKLKERLAAGVTVNKNFEDGVRDSFPMLSIKGKVFRIRIDGNEQPLIDRQTNQVIPYLDVVLANASRLIAKSYYVKGFSDDGDFAPPDCWSLDSIRPDPSVANKVSPTCANCPMNQFGSAPSRDPTEGKRGGKACADARRIAVVMPGHLGQGPDKPPMTFLMRVPATSLKSLKQYAQNLERNGWEPAACVTRLAFDYKEAYPKLTFNFVDGLDDAEYGEVVDIAESPSVASMLMAPDFDAVAPTETTPNTATEQRVRQEAPILGNEAPGGVPPREPMQRQGAATQQTQAPVQQQTVKAVEATLIELPDGQLFNPLTKEYVQREQPKVEMPTEDPATIELPDGRFFNATSRQFVVSRLVGAAVVADTAAPPAGEPAKRVRASRAKPKESPAAEVQAKADPQASSPPVDNTVGNGAAAPAAAAANTTSGVEPAPAVLESILDSILPKR